MRDVILPSSPSQENFKKWYPNIVKANRLGGAEARGNTHTSPKKSHTTMAKEIKSVVLGYVRPRLMSWLGLTED
jgi:hypothetical protein